MIKKIFLAIVLLSSFLLHSQTIEESTGYKSNGLTTTQLNALPLSIKVGLVIRNSSIGKIVTWDENLNDWVQVGSGAGGGSSIWGGITGTLSNQTDLQSALDAKGGLGSTQTWTGVNTFNGNLDVGNIFTTGGQIRADDASDSNDASLSPGGIQITSTDGLRNWSIGNRDGIDVSGRLAIRPLGSWDTDIFEYDYGQNQWEIDASPVITAANAAANGIGATGPAGSDGADGADGVGVSSTVDNLDGTFTINYTDLSSFTTSDFTDPQGPQGIQGIQGPAGNDGNDGADGAVGPEGPQGPQGPAGPGGSATQWRQGAGAPSNGDGSVDNDFYFNTSNGDVYQKQTGSYIQIANIQGADGAEGPQGIQGSTGPQGNTGDTGAQGAPGADGDDGLSAYQIWINNGNSGTEPDFLASLIGADGADGAQGPQGIQGEDGPTGAQGPPGNDGADGATGSAGADGADGKTVLNGTGVPSGGLGVDGDFYIDTALSFIYGPKTGGSWGAPTSLVGPQGPAGVGSLSDLTDVGTVAPTNRHTLIGDGIDFDTRALVAEDIVSGTFAVARIPDLSSTYATLTGANNFTNVNTFNTATNFNSSVRIGQDALSEDYLIIKSGSSLNIRPETGIATNAFSTNALEINNSGNIIVQGIAVAGGTSDELMLRDGSTASLAGLGGGGGVPDDDSVTPAKMADDDFGAFTFSGGFATLDASSVGSSQIETGGVQAVDLAAQSVTLGKLFSANAGTSGQYLTRNASQFEWVDAPSGGLTTDQLNRLLNENKFAYLTKTSNFSVTSEDVEISSGADIGKKSIIDFTTGNVIGELEDSDLAVGESLILQSNGGTANLHFAGGETALFYDGAGNSNTQINIAAGNEVTIIKKATDYFRASGEYTLSVYDVTPPSVPTNLVNSANTSTTSTWTWDASTDNVAVDHYEVSIDDGPDIDVGNVLTYDQTGKAPSTLSNLKVKAVDAVGNESAFTANVPATTLAGSSYVYRIGAGDAGASGETFTPSNGAPDFIVVGDNFPYNSTDIDITGVDGWTARPGLMTTFDTSVTGASPNGDLDATDFDGAGRDLGGDIYGAGLEVVFKNLAATTDYTVRLYVVDFFFPGAGGRVFDVTANGTLLFDDLDISGQFGEDVVGMVSGTATSTAGGVITLDFTASANNPTFVAIELLTQ